MMDNMSTLILCQIKACMPLLIYNSMANINRFSPQEWKVLALQSWFEGPKSYVQ